MVNVRSVVAFPVPPGRTAVDSLEHFVSVTRRTAPEISMASAQVCLR